MAFGKTFTWGVATASYQIEGAAHEDGRKPSVWDMFARKPGATYLQQNGDVACDHYHRYEEDVNLMKGLGVGAYRFSVAWPRILPDGICDVNPKGIAFYDRLVDKLLEAGITPWVTLFHWDLPLALYYQGGWLNPDSPKWFAEYSRVVCDALSDRVQHWITENEPQCFIGSGLGSGQHAPGDQLGWSEVLLAAHHSLVAHGMSVQTIRAHAKRAPKIGIAEATTVGIAASGSPSDAEAARRFTFEVKGKSVWHLAWWLDPIVFGKYPEDGVTLYGKEMPDINPDDLKVISEPLDFLGLNIYHGKKVACENGDSVIQPRPVGAPLTAFKWDVEPECLYWGPRLYHERYKLPIVITENGLSNQDWPTLDGKVHDPLRIDYLHRHLRELKRASEDGVPVDGYFEWSLLDNFEWAEGYKERFGLVYVDYESQRRIPKDSYYWFQKVIRENGKDI